MALLSHNWRAALVILGGVLVHLTLGTLYTFGNMNPYITSYMRYKNVSPDLTSPECSWIFALSAMGQGSTMLLGGILEKRIGPRLTTLAGAWFMSLGVLVTHFSIQHSFAATIITYGLMFGLGCGCAYGVPLACAVRWMPHRKGLVNGLVVAGFGGGAFIFNQVQTAYINPDNLKTNGTYFTQKDLLDRVPNTFLIMGGCYAVMQLLGCLLICNPPNYSKVEPLKEEEKEERPFKDDSLVNTPAEERHGRVEAEGEKGSHSLLLMLKSRHFYLLFFMFFLNGQGTTFISTLYKAYGQTFITDDTFLAWVGAFAAVFNGCGRIFWGFVADKSSVRVGLMCMTAAFTVLMLTFQVTKVAGQALFFIYVCLLFGSFSGSFVLFPTATAKIWGSTNLAMHYGLLFVSQVVTAPIGVFMSQHLEELIGWNGMFFVVSGCTFTSFVLAIVFRAKDIDGEEI